MAEITGITYSAAVRIKQHITTKYNNVQALANEHRRTYEQYTDREEKGEGDFAYQRGHYLGRSDAYRIMANELSHLKALAEEFIAEENKRHG